MYRQGRTNWLKMAEAILWNPEYGDKPGLLIARALKQQYDRGYTRAASRRRRGPARPIRHKSGGDHGVVSIH